MCAAGDEVYDDFAAAHGRRHSTPQEYEHRRQVFHDNRKFIEDWNSEAHNSESHMLALNHFADWTQVCMRLSPILLDLAQSLHAILKGLHIPSLLQQHSIS